MSFCEICTIGLAWPPVCGTDVEACRAAKGFVWIETDGELAMILGFFLFFSEKIYYFSSYRCFVNNLVFCNLSLCLELLLGG